MKLFLSFVVISVSSFIIQFDLCLALFGVMDSSLTV